MRRATAVGLKRLAHRVMDLTAARPSPERAGVVSIPTGTPATVTTADPGTALPDLRAMAEQGTAPALRRVAEPQMAAQRRATGAPARAIPSQALARSGHRTSDAASPEPDVLTVFTEGVFDLLHANHMAMLRQVRSMGDRLIVGVTPDADAAAYKRVPILTLEERMETLRASGLADEVVVCPTANGAALTEAFLKAHDIGLVVYSGTGWDEFYRVPTEMGIMLRLPYRGGLCTSTIIDRIRARDDL